MTRVGSQRHRKEKKSNQPEDGSQLEPKNVAEQNNVKNTP
jgi:hypothetical protein